jgi:putative ATPase
MRSQGKSIPGTSIAQGQSSKLLKTLIVNSGSTTIQVRHGDLTLEAVGCIVNAANTNLEHSGGLALAICKAGGQCIQDESDLWIAKNGPCPYGCVVPFKVNQASSSNFLKCQYVLHCVGPQWRQGQGHADMGGPEAVMILAVQNCLKAAESLRLDSISMPAISSGIFGYPRELCAKNLFDTVISYFRGNPCSCIKTVCFTNFDDPTCQVFSKECDDQSKQQTNSHQILQNISSNSSTESKSSSEHKTSTASSRSIEKTENDISSPNKNQVTSDEAKLLLANEYGLKNVESFTMFPSYDDQNLMFSCSDGKKFVLKLHNLMFNSQSNDVLECQNKTLQTLAAHGIDAPRVIPALSGAFNVDVPHHPQMKGRLLSYLHGNLLVDALKQTTKYDDQHVNVTAAAGTQIESSSILVNNNIRETSSSHSSVGDTCVLSSFSFTNTKTSSQACTASQSPSTYRLLTKLAQHLAKIDKAIEKVEHSGAHRINFEWDLDNCLTTISKYKMELPSDKLVIIDAYFNHYRDFVHPYIKNLPRQMIHGDANDYNVVVQKAKQSEDEIKAGGPEFDISGVIDFGDSCITRRVYDISICVGYMMLDQKAPMDVAFSMIQSYHNTNALTEQELLRTFDICLFVCLFIY